MTDSEKADALLRMMDMHLAKWRQTRDLEVRVNLAIWTALVVVGGFLAAQREVGVNRLVRPRLPPQRLLPGFFERR
jgi:hypothetical protein